MSYVPLVRFLEQIRNSGIATELVHNAGASTCVMHFDQFKDRNHSECESLLLKIISMEESQLRELEYICGLRFVFLSLDEPLPAYLQEKKYPHWLNFAVDSLTFSGNSTLPEKVRVVHFYGYKGGQARSTVMACLAKYFAENGKRVLVIENDVEAPSLRYIFGAGSTTIESTLIALASLAIECSPARLFSASPSGQVDGILASVANEEYNFENLALALRIHLSPEVLEHAISKSRSIVSKYDLVFIDHRAGFSDLVIPWMRALGGELVVFSRPDGQWREAKHSLQRLSESFGREHTSLVPFLHLDLDENDPDPKTIHDIEDLQETCLGDPKTSDEDDFPLFFWGYDPVFCQQRLPSFSQLKSATTRDSFLQLAARLGGAFQHTPSISGAKDTRPFVNHPGADNLFARVNESLFILGRKGTGKTRLLMRLLERQQDAAFALVCDAQINKSLPPALASQMGLPCPGSLVTTLGDRYSGNFERMWWRLIVLRLRHLNQGSSIDFSSFVKSWLATNQTDDAELLEIRNELISSLRPGRPTTLCIESLELLFNSITNTRAAVGALLRLFQEVETSPDISAGLSLVIFCRKDLMDVGQNAKQIIEGKEIDISWSYRQFLNLFSVRILSSIQKWPPARVAKLQKLSLSDLLSGNLPFEECEEALLEFLPKENYPEQKRTMQAFLRSYFTDTENILASRAVFRPNRGHYLPRLLDFFLIAIEARNDQKWSGELIKSAFVDAAEKYVAELKEELRIALNLGQESDVESLCHTLSSSVIPVEENNLIEQLSAALKQPAPLSHQQVQTLKQLGVLEERSQSVRRSDSPELRMAHVYRVGLGVRRNTKKSVAMANTFSMS